MAEQNGKASDNILSDTILIGAATSVAYWLAFRYEAGYFDFFNIPLQLVQVRLESILYAALAMSGAGFVVFAVANLFAMHWPSHADLQYKLLRVLIVLLAPVWLLLNYGPRVEDWPLYLFAFAFLFIFEIVWPILAHRDGVLKEKFIADEQSERTARSKTIAGQILTHGGLNWYILFAIFLLGGPLASIAGRAEAERKIEYFLLADRPSTAVVRLYQDIIIARPFDPDTKEFKQELIILKLDSDNVKGIRVMMDQKIGPLKASKK